MDDDVGTSERKIHVHGLSGPDPSLPCLGLTDTEAKFEIENVLALNQYTSPLLDAKASPREMHSGGLEGTLREWLPENMAERW
jgi:hypothetical protein